MSRKIICPLWDKNQKHPDHCCKLVGCAVCKNVWCTIGNPQVKGITVFSGYIAVCCQGIVIGYFNLEKVANGVKGIDNFVHDPRTEGATAIGIREVPE